MKLRVAAPPESGKANDAMLDFLGDRLGCSVSLETGAGQRRKTVRAHHLTPHMVEIALARATPSEDEPSTVHGAR